MGAEAECLILFFEGLGVCYLLAGGWRWHRAKFGLEPAEIQSNVFSYMHGHFYFCCLIGNITISSNCREQFYKSYMQGYFYFCRLIGNIAICSNCSVQFHKSFVPGYFYFSQLSYIVSVL